LGRNTKAILEQITTDGEQLSKYDVGQTCVRLARDLGKKPTQILKLNSNENFFVPRSLLRDLLKEVAEEVDLRVYPRDEIGELREALTGYLPVSPEEIVIGGGSDQLIERLSQIVLSRGDEARSTAPTFSMYERCVRIQGGTYRPVPLRADFSLDTEKMLTPSTPRSKLLFLCSPNNPTGNQFDRADVETLANGFDGLLVVDEAYADFAADSVVDLVNEFENLVVLRTFSKAFGIAGLRLGYAVTNRNLARVIDERFQMPYSASNIAIRLAQKLLDNFNLIRNAIAELKAERAKLITKLRQVDRLRAFDSEANFVLFQTERGSDEVYTSLLAKGIIIKNIGKVLHLDGCLRVTVAPSPVTERFISALTEVLDENAE